jgi:PPK2 family polyphosphate:nucleotide phosphotransferase
MQSLRRENKLALQLFCEAIMKQYRVKPGDKFKLSDRDPNDTGDFSGGKVEGKTRTAELNAELEALQELMYAQHQHKMLVILQAMDTGGKDGLIRSVFEGVNPTGVHVASFKAPSSNELDHDYLWRIHQRTPALGEIVIFNRSHYEDVVVVRVHSLVPKDAWQRRFRHIREFERMLSDEGVTILKFFLNIDKDEQKARLHARLDDPAKHWKFNVGDIKERAHWDDYMKAYEEAIVETSTDEAPWYIVPANKKWYRDLVVSTLLVDKLKSLKMSYPPSTEDLSNVEIP